MPATDGPTGLRPDAHGAVRDVEDTDGGKIDELAATSVSDIEEYWEQRLRRAFDGEFTPVEELISWDADGFDGTSFCDEDTYGLVNAAFCFDDNTIGWDRGELLPALRKANGDMGVTMVLAHEYGHAVQHQAGLDNKKHPDAGRPSSRPTASPARTCAGSPRTTHRGSRCPPVTG